MARNFVFVGHTNSDKPGWLFCRLNNAVFGSRLPTDLQISWNAHLKTTAGLTHYSRVTLAGDTPK